MVYAAPCVPGDHNLNVSALFTDDVQALAVATTSHALLPPSERRHHRVRRLYVRR